MTTAQTTSGSIPRSMLNAYRLSEALSKVAIASSGDQDFSGGTEAFSQEELDQLNRLCQKGERILNTKMSVLFSLL